MRARLSSASRSLRSLSLAVLAPLVAIACGSSDDTSPPPSDAGSDATTQDSAPPVDTIDSSAIDATAVGTDGSTGDDDTADGGSDLDGSSPLDASDASDAADANAAADASDASDAADGSHASDGGVCAVTAPSDAGTTLVNNWTKTDPGAGLMTTDIGSINGGGCTVTLRGAKYQPTAQPTVYSTYLVRTDDGSGLCQGPLGYVLLNGSSYSVPGGGIVRAPTQLLFAVAYNYKNGPNGSPYTVALAQLDWATGALLRQGELAVNGSNSGLPTQVTATGLTLAAGGCGVVLDGIGSFPGATGTGANFQATYLNFLAQAVQDATKASSAIQTN